MSSRCLTFSWPYLNEEERIISLEICVVVSHPFFKTFPYFRCRSIETRFPLFHGNWSTSCTSDSKYPEMIFRESITKHFPEVACPGCPYILTPSALMLSENGTIFSWICTWDLADLAAWSYLYNQTGFRGQRDQPGAEYFCFVWKEMNKYHAILQLSHRCPILLFWTQTTETHTVCGSTIPVILK